MKLLERLIINSFGHRIFDNGQSNEIAVFKNRIEIYNPGVLPEGLSFDDFIKGNSRPIRRNPLIARTLYYSKDMESFATGLKRIISACEQANCKVEFHQEKSGVVVTFYRSTPQVDPQVTLQVNPQVNTQDAIIEFCNIPRSRKEIASHVGLTDVRYLTSKYLKSLLEARLIKMTIPDKPNSKNQKYISVK